MEESPNTLEPEVPILGSLECNNINDPIAYDNEITVIADPVNAIPSNDQQDVTMVSEIFTSENLGKRRSESDFIFYEECPESYFFKKQRSGESPRPITPNHLQYPNSISAKNTYSRLFFLGPGGTLETIQKYLYHVFKPEGKVGESNELWLMKQLGRSYTWILKEYLYTLLRLTPKYLEFSTPNGYYVIVTISTLKYGCGFGSTMKIAKAEAAKRTLAMVIPSMRTMNIWQ